MYYDLDDFDGADGCPAGCRCCTPTEPEPQQFEGETGECSCGQVTDYFGPDPFTDEMCRSYNTCEPDCDCSDPQWICDDCYAQSCADI